MKYIISSLNTFGVQFETGWSAYRYAWMSWFSGAEPEIVRTVLIVRMWRLLTDTSFPIKIHFAESAKYWRRALYKALIPFSSLAEQKQIVSEIETRLSICDQLEQTIEDSLNKAEALRQSILKKAFEGELTRDWREKHPELITGENSVEKLLEKIKVEKARSAIGRNKLRSKKTKKNE